eukprot:4155123-Pyramimonas_sp.AAC.1
MESKAQVATEQHAHGPARSAFCRGASCFEWRLSREKRSPRPAVSRCTCQRWIARSPDLFPGG